MKLLAKILLGFSALLNLALAVVLIAGSLSSPPAPVAPSAADAAQAAAAKARAETAAMWSTLQTDDLATLVAHLRSAGFPPNIIRAILAAQLRDEFAARRKAIEGASNQAYWKNAAIDPKQQQALRDLSREQEKILRDLLGPDADANDGFGLAFRDRGLSGLPAAKADQVRQILRDFDQQRQDLYATVAIGGIISFGTAEREKMKAIDAAQRAEIAKVLTPDELENYELMASNTAQSLRYQLSAFNATEDEFRTLYKLQKQFDETAGGPMYGPPSPAEMRTRRDAQNQLNQQIELALGAQRYADYQRATDYNYRQTTLLVARLELPADTANQLYTIQKDYQQRVRDAQLNAMSSGGGDTVQQLTALQQEALAKVAPILGSDQAVEAYKQYGGSWITNMVPRMASRPRVGAPAPAAPAPAPKT